MSDDISGEGTDQAVLQSTPQVLSPNRLLLEGPEVIQAPSSLRTRYVGPIMWETHDYCRCSVNLTPAEFWSFWKGKQKAMPYVTLFHVSTEEIICLLLSSIDKFLIFLLN